MNNWCQPGGQTCAFGGAVMVHVVPEQDNAGKIVLCPMLFPCVLESAPMSEAFMFAVLPAVMVMLTDCPYDQSLFAIVYDGRDRPESRYGGM